MEADKLQIKVTDVVPASLAVTSHKLGSTASQVFRLIGVASLRQLKIAMECKNSP